MCLNLSGPNNVLEYGSTNCPAPLFAYLFGNSRLPNSFEGEPVLALPGPTCAVALLMLLPSGYRRPVPAGASMGLFVAEVLAERFWFMFSEPRPSRLSL